MRIAFRPRRAIVTFRLSGDEYELVKVACVSAGSRSLSDYAREAVLSRVARESSPPKQEPELPDITACLDRLNAAMTEMDGKLSTILQNPVFTDTKDESG